MKPIEYIDLLLENEDDLRYKLAGFKHDEKSIELNKCYHVTQLSKKDIILSEGLKPYKPNINEPSAVYLTPNVVGALSLAKLIYGEKRLKEDYVLFEIDCKGLKLYKDPFSIRENGVYSLTAIEPKRIKLISIIDFDIIRNEKNWKEFRNWWYWKQSPKPTFVKKFNLPQYK